MAAAATVITLLSAPVIEWIDRAPEIAASIKEKLYVLDIAARRVARSAEHADAAGRQHREGRAVADQLVAPVIAAVTPAVAQVVIFAATLFFALVAQVEVRRH